MSLINLLSRNLDLNWGCASVVGHHWYHSQILSQAVWTEGGQFISGLSRLKKRQPLGTGCLAWTCVAPVHAASVSEFVVVSVLWSRPLVPSGCCNLPASPSTELPASAANDLMETAIKSPVLQGHSLWSLSSSGSLYLFPSPAGRAFDDGTRHWPTSIAECC